MLEIDISPIVSICTYQIRWATIFTILALITGIITGIIEAKRYQRRRPEIISGLAFSSLIGMVIGGKLFYSLDNWSILIQNPAEVIFNFLINMYGIIIGAIAGTIIYCIIARVPLWQTADIIAPGVILGLAVYRIGCILTGCCYGLYNNSFCSVAYTNPATMAPFGKLLYPTAIFHIIASLLVFTVLWLLRKKLKPEGSLFLLMLALLAATDLPIRLFRVGEPFLFGLQQAQLIGILVLLVSIPWLVIKMKTNRTEIKKNL
jgi:phosphatidylglycerol:prolipoprotein diacylglycerol transferase